MPWVHAATLAATSTSLRKTVYHPDITKQQWDLILSPGPSMTLHPSRVPQFRISDKVQALPAKYRGLPVWAAYPGFAVIPMLDSTLWHSILPFGPDRMELIVGLAFPTETGAAYRAGDQRVRELCDAYARKQESIMTEDNEICERQQLGLGARSAAAGRFCKHEILAWKFDNWVARMAYGGGRPDRNGGAPERAGIEIAG